MTRTRSISLAALVGLLASLLTLPAVQAHTAVLCRGVEATIVGTEGDDELIGTAGDDVIAGLAGDDRIFGLGGNDIICGGQGRDYINGGRAGDWLSGGPQADVMHGGHGGDIMRGGGGADLMLGGWGKDTIFGDGEDDEIHGGYNYDTIDGGTGDDSLWADPGPNLVRGKAGTDQCSGNGRIIQCEDTHDRLHDIEDWRSLVEEYFQPEDVEKALGVIYCETAQFSNPWILNFQGSGTAGLFQHHPDFWAERTHATAHWRGEMALPGVGDFDVHYRFPNGFSPFDARANVVVAAWLVYETTQSWNHWTQTSQNCGA